MSKKRGLSVEEKRTRMMEFFFEKKDFFQLKELEKLCQKEKGITSMSVKDILTSLVDDGMVDTEKIGTSVYFWAFPSKASQNMLLHSRVCGKRKRKMDDLTKSITDIASKRKHVEELLAKAQVGREDSDNRAAILSELSTKQSECQELESELKRYHDCDPEVVEEMKEEASVCKESANRWTDNIFSIKSWAKNKFHFEDSVLDKQFGIPDDLDYLD